MKTAGYGLVLLTKERDNQYGISEALPRVRIRSDVSLGLQVLVVYFRDDGEGPFGDRYRSRLKLVNRAAPYRLAVRDDLDLR
jgi:hypothetical protein